MITLSIFMVGFGIGGAVGITIGFLIALSSDDKEFIEPPRRCGGHQPAYTLPREARTPPGRPSAIARKD